MKTDKEMEEFERYLRSDEVRPSHTFLLNEAKSYPAFTTHGLNQLPYVLMPAVALCMEKYADQEKQALKEMVLSEIAQLSELQTTDDLTPFGSGKLSAFKAVRDFMDSKTLNNTDPRDSGLDDSWIHDVDMGAKS